jgi:hypothetical protein
MPMWSPPRSRHSAHAHATSFVQRFGIGGAEPRTLQSLGNALHLSRERVRQLQNDALHQLRRAVERDVVIAQRRRVRWPSGGVSATASSPSGHL